MKKKTKTKFELAKKKQAQAKLWFKGNPNLKNVDIKAMLVHKYGSDIADNYLATIRKELGITGGTLRDKPKYARRGKKAKITQDDVIVLQKCCDIPEDIREVIQFTIEYMCETGISYLEMHDDGNVKIKLQQELETTV